MRISRFSGTIAIALIASSLLITVTARRASACSCAVGDTRDNVAAAEAAFVGNLVQRTDEPDGQVTFTFSVEQDLKDNLDDEVHVLSSFEGSSCAMDVAVGQQVGLLLYSRDGEWQSGGACSLMVAGQFDSSSEATLVRRASLP
jgi:hypothetical protein